MYYVFVSALTKNGFDVRYTHPNLLFISWINKTSRSTLMIEDSHQNNYSNTDVPQQSSSFSISNNSNSSNNDVVSSVLDNFKPENKILFNTKKINTVDEKLAKLLGN